MRIVALIFFAGLLSGSVLAQDDVGVSYYPQNGEDSLRATYIKPYRDYFFLWPVVKQRRLDFDMERRSGDGRKISYKSNKPYSLGVGLYLFELGFELAFAVPMNEQDKRVYGQSKARDLQLNILGKKWGGDLFFQKYSGFYIDDPALKIPLGGSYPQRSDITTKNLGVTLNYTFNYKKFSFRSAYNYAERQLRSSGSFLLFGSFSRFKTAGDSAILGESYADEFGTDSNIRGIKLTSLSVAPGYTYSVIYKGFFLNGMLAIGPSHSWLNYTMDTGETKYDIKFDAFLAARLGLGYNGDRFFGGLSFMSQGQRAKLDHVQLNSSNGVFKIMIGYRFKEFGVLKKRIWELPEELLK
jgi:hypothetical protein